MVILIQSNPILGCSVGDIKNADKMFGYDSRNVTCNLARRFLECLPEGRYIVDSRTHMLMPGWLPCIGGWHLDEVKRDEDGNLDFKNNNNNKEHYFMILDYETGSLTEFVNEPLGDVKPKTYKDLSMAVNMLQPDTSIIKSNCLYNFDCNDIHRGRKATGKGWRYFIRATLNTQREYMNEEQTQTQVYIESENEGW